LHGAFKNKVDNAFPHRDMNYGFLISSRWEDISDDNVNIQWTREVYKMVCQKGTPSSYLNYSMPEHEDTERLVMGGSLDRLKIAKLQYDPLNVFRRNHNIIATNT